MIIGIEKQKRQQHRPLQHRNHYYRSRSSTEKSVFNPTQSILMIKHVPGQSLLEKTVQVPSKTAATSAMPSLFQIREQLEEQTRFMNEDDKPPYQQRQFREKACKSSIFEFCNRETESEDRSSLSEHRSPLAFNEQLLGQWDRNPSVPYSPYNSSMPYSPYSSLGVQHLSNQSVLNSSLIEFPDFSDKVHSGTTKLHKSQRRNKEYTEDEFYGFDQVEQTSKDGHQCPPEQFKSNLREKAQVNNFDSHSVNNSKARIDRSVLKRIQPSWGYVVLAIGAFLIVVQIIK